MNYLLLIPVLIGVFLSWCSYSMRVAEAKKKNTQLLYKDKLGVEAPPNFTIEMMMKELQEVEKHDRHQEE
jgi:hypothetical protein